LHQVVIVASASRRTPKLRCITELLVSSITELPVQKQVQMLVQKQVQMLVHKLVFKYLCMITTG